MCWELVVLSLSSKYRIANVDGGCPCSHLWIDTCFHLDFGPVIIFLHLCTKSDNWLVCPDKSCGILFQTSRLKSNTAGTNTCLSMWRCSVVEKKLVEMFPPCLAFHMSRVKRLGEWFHKSLCFWVNLRPKWSYSVMIIPFSSMYSLISSLHCRFSLCVVFHELRRFCPTLEWCS